MPTIKTKLYHSPVGELILGSFEEKLCICDWVADKRRQTTDRRILRHFQTIYEEGNSETIEHTLRELDEYFAGERQEFDIPLAFSGTPFQCDVWKELLRIPYGETISYAELARRIRNPKAVRAVALANASNPISIFVPCHRVIGSNRTLTGYAGGLAAKQALLELEKATI